MTKRHSEKLEYYVVYKNSKGDWRYKRFRNGDKASIFFQRQKNADRLEVWINGELFRTLRKGD